MKKIDIEQKVDAAMNSLNELTPAKAPDDFLSKLESRLAFTNKENHKWMSLLKIGVAAMIVMSLLNGYLLIPNEQEDYANYEDFTAEYFESNTDLIEF